MATPKVPDQAPEIRDVEAQLDNNPKKPVLMARRSFSESNVTLHQPLLSSSQPSSSSSLAEELTLMQQAISQTLESTANLAKRLPTGTVLAFQLLSPIFTEVGRCSDADRDLTLWLLGICALSCFLLSFTDSFKEETGKLRYGFATAKGLWMVDGLKPPAPEVAVQYKVTILDFIHGFTSVLVFTAVALFDKNVVTCFNPVPSRDMQQVLAVLPIGTGVLGSALFILFPTNRHGIGFPAVPAS